jgi:hypothetical protein
MIRWLNSQTNRHMRGWVGGWVDGQVGRWMIDGWMDGWTERRTDGFSNSSAECDTMESKKRGMRKVSISTT